MKNQILLFALILLALSSCSKKVSQFDQETSHHQRIAVMPIQSTITLTPKQMENITDAELHEMELNQSKEVQNAIESYLVNKKLRVKIQSASITNSKLRDAGVDIASINDVDVTKLADILGVDAVVGGFIETKKPMSDQLATGIDMAKGLENSILGTSFGSGVNSSTNKGHCNINIYEAKHGDRLWTFNDDIELPKGSSTQDIVNNMMKQGAKSFPYKK